MINKSNGYLFTTVPRTWEEAMLCGNGTIGTIVMGQPIKEKLLFTHEKLFIPLSDKVLPPNMGKYLDKIRKMLLNGQYRAVSQFVWNIAKNEGYESLVWTSPFFPAFDLNIDFEEGPFEDYKRELDFSTGLSRVELRVNNNLITREFFVSRKRNIAVLRITSDSFIRTLIDISHRSLTENNTNNNLEKGIRKYQNYIEDNFIIFNNYFSYSNGGYIAVAKIISSGEKQKREKAIEVLADEILIILTLDVYEGDVNIEKYKEKLNEATIPFSHLFKEHKDIHTKIYERIQLSLKKSDNSKSDQLLWESAKKGMVENQFIEKMFNAGRYAVLSSTGEYPPVLQGIWAGSYHVPWSSDYTHDGNLPTVLLCMLPCNMHELLLSYFKYLNDIMPDMKINASRLYNSRGIVLPSRSSRGGLNFHFNEDWPLLFWTAGAAWAARYFYDYWLYTQDNEFFRTVALPFMKEVALFYEDFLIEDKNGKWIFIPSYSPENTPKNSDSQASINATMDIAAAKELFKNLIKACTTLGIEEENIEKWKAILSKMPEYHVNKDGALKEWCYNLEDNYDHRHASHLYPLYYEIDDEIISKNLQEACKRAYKIKEEKKQKEEGIMAFGLIQIGMVAAHLKDGETVKEIIYKLAKSYYFSNYASSHDAGPSLFNTDISGGLPALISECFVQSTTIEKNMKIVGFKIELMPIIIDTWDEGEIKGIRTRGGFEIDLSWGNCKLKSAKIYNHFNRQAEVVYNGKPVVIDRDTKECVLDYDDFC